MISVVIPTYKNRDVLLKNLAHNLPFLKGCEIVVVNDDPEESLRGELASYREITLIENDINLGFGQSVNKGVEKAKGDYILFLNSDVLLVDDRFKTSVQLFEKDKRLFGIGFAQREKGGRRVGRNRWFWRRGLFIHKAVSSITGSVTAWVEGGACMIDRKKYTELGGFDPLYTPFYWEDIDLSYRARVSGYRVLFDPSVVVDHQHESTIGTYFSASFIKTIAYRNQIIFIWKNISDGMLMREHLVFLPLVVVSSLFRGEFEFIGGLFQAIFKLGTIVKRRKRQNETRKISDKEILEDFL